MMEGRVTKPCPLCRRPSDITPYGQRDAFEIVCAKCGHFVLTRRMFSLIEGLSEEDRKLLPYLSAHTRQSSEAGTIAEIHSENWKELARARAATPVSMKLGMALQWCGRSSPHGGAKVIVDFDLTAPLFDAVSEDEAWYLADNLVKAGYLETLGGDPRVCIVTPAGWAKLQPSSRGGVPGRCFVAMSFDPSVKDAFDQGIRPAIEEDCKLSAVRVDLVEHNEKICDRIVAEINRAEFVVADFTLHRAGVYFEVGYAQGLGRPVIWTCRKDELGKTHFDTRQYNHIDWETPAELRRRLGDRIRATILK